MTQPARSPALHRTSVVQVETPIMLGHPAERPKALIAALRRELSGLPDVTGAWLMLAARADEPTHTWMLGVETGGPWSSVQLALGRAIDVMALCGRPLDAVQMGRSGLTDTLRGGIPVLKRLGLLGLLGF